MLSPIQKQRLEVMARCKAELEATGCVVKLEALGVLIIVTPEYGEPGAEQLFLEATEPQAGTGGKARG
jgi:hypothetical protein